MINFFEIPDYHFDPKWSEEQKFISDVILTSTKINKIDFILLPGDLHNRGLYATDRGGFNELKKIISKWAEVVPVAAIYGTPSHEPAGALDALADIGLVVLHPNTVYGYYRDRQLIKKIDGVPDCVLFGIPEISTSKIQSKLKTSAEEANAAALKQLDRHIVEFITPNRLKYESIPAVAMYHGVVSDYRAENQTDKIITASDIVVHTEILEPANIDRWSLGHIHTPWESSVVFGGYAGFTGFDNNPWGKTNFVPGLNMITIGDGLKKLKRIPYGTPERVKISNPADAVNKNIAYWLESTDPNAQLPTTVHPWSRSTYTPPPKKTVRVNREDLLAAKTLADQCSLMTDDKLKKSIIDKLHLIEQQTRRPKMQKKEFELLSVEICGCILLDEKLVRFDFDKLPIGLIGLQGDNGSGKSSLLAFCSYYPIVIGKDTLSGRPSAIKDFFSGKKSYIKKVFVEKQTGIIHEHHITIKDAKCYCYLFVKNENQLSTTSWSEMMTKCEDIAGPFNDYLLTSFYVQPQQGSLRSGLMDANITTIRDSVLSIAGIDRDAEKNIALNEVKKLKEQFDKIKNWIDGASENNENTEELLNEKKRLSDKILMDELLLAENKKIYQGNKRRLDVLYVKKIKTDNEIDRRHKNEAREHAIIVEIDKIKNEIDELKKMSINIEANKSIIEADDLNRDKKNKLEQYKNSCARIDIEYQNKKNEQDQKNKSIKMDIEFKNKRIKSSEEYILKISSPCKKCGYIDEDIKSEIDKIRTRIDADKSEIENLKTKINNTPIKKGSYPPSPGINDNIKTLNSVDRDLIFKKIQAGQTAENKITHLQARIIAMDGEAEKLKTETYDIDDNVNINYQNVRDVVAKNEKLIESMTSDLSKNKSLYDGYLGRIDRANKIKNKIEEGQIKLKSVKSDLNDWEEIAILLRPNKLPAFELESVLDAIDDRANNIIQSIEEGRYFFETRTQYEGKKSSVDKFDIIITDAETGSERSITRYNPGHKAFFADAYTKALISIRQERSSISFTPIILDEADGPIHPSRINDYYRLQQTYWTGSRVIVVSHNPTSHQYISNQINMEDLKNETINRQAGR